MRLAVIADHNGVAMKARLVAWLSKQGHVVDDRGIHDPARVVDYPWLCADVCGEVLGARADRAVVIGGTGSGEQIACNKIAGIRAALCQDPLTARISRANNDTNVLVLGAKVVGVDLALELAAIWLGTPFSGGRHRKRLDLIARLERGEPLA